MRALGASRTSLVPGGVLAGPWVRDGLWRRARAVPSLDLRFADNKSLTDAVTGASLVTFTRASSGTYVDSAGVLQTAATDVPRFDHNPTTGESLGLLVEEQRSNLLLHNRTLTNAAWVASNITPAKDQVGADGVSNSASSITASAGNGTILQTITSASAARATSAYVKRITGTGTIEMTQNNGSTWTAVTVTSAWTRVTIPSATVTDPVVGFRIVTSGDAIAVDYAQLENGAFSTSAIETTTAAVTRSADVCSITGSAFSSWYRQDEGSFFVSHDARSLLLVANNNAFSERQPQIGLAAALIHDFYNITGGVVQANNVGLAHVIGTTSRAAYTYKTNDFIGAVNGSLTISDSSGSVSSSVSQLNIGAFQTGASVANGTLKRITFWPQRLANSTLQSLTQ